MFAKNDTTAKPSSPGCERSSVSAPIGFAFDAKLVDGARQDLEKHRLLVFEGGDQTAHNARVDLADGDLQIEMAG